MFFLNPFAIAGVVIFTLIFLAGIAFWIVFGIKKFKWALITSIVISALFVMTAGMFSLRMVSAKVISGGRAPGQFSKIERIMDKKDFGMFGQRGSFVKKCDPEGGYKAGTFTDFNRCGKYQGWWNTGHDK